MLFDREVWAYPFALRRYERCLRVYGLSFRVEGQVRYLGVYVLPGSSPAQVVQGSSLATVKFAVPSSSSRALGSPMVCNHAEILLKCFDHPGLNLHRLQRFVRHHQWGPLLHPSPSPVHLRLDTRSHVNSPRILVRIALGFAFMRKGVPYAADCDNKSPKSKRSRIQALRVVCCGVWKFHLVRRDADQDPWYS